MARQFRPGQLQTGSLYNISSSYALTASYALNGGGTGTNIDTGSFVTTSSFGAFTASYTTGSFTGSFIGDGSQLTGIVSSKWTGSNPISRQSDVEITGSLRVLGSITGSLLGTASNATTASYFNETDPIFVAKSGSFATTGSNTFKGNQTISGSIYLNSGSVINSTGADLIIKAGVGNNAGVALYNNNFTQYLAVDDTGSYANKLTVADKLTIAGSNGKLIYTGTTPGVGSNPTLAEVHANDDFPWLHRFYNDTFSTSSAVMAYYGWNDGRFVFHNESTQSIGLQVNGFGAENGLLVYSDKVAFVNNVEVTGSLNVVGGITGSLFGTASWANNAVTASYIQTAQTASYVLQAVSSSFSTTSSYALTASYVNPLIQTVTITGSLNISGSTTQIGTNNLLGQTNLSGSIYVSGSVNALADFTLGGTLRLDPAQDPGNTNATASFLFTSASNTEQGYDLYYRQDGNLVKFKWLEGGISSGLLYGGLISASGATVYVSSGSGVILDPNASFSKEINPIFTYVTWPNYSASATYLTSSQNTYLYVDAAGTIHQQIEFFDQTQYEQAIPLGRATHPNYATITGIGSNVQTTYDSDSQQSAFIRGFGPLKIDGFSINAHPGTLGFGIGSGVAYTLGGFYSQDPNSPSHYHGNAFATSSIARAYRSGSGVRLDNNGGAFYSTVDPDYWDDGTGVLNTMASGDWQIQRVFANPVTGRVVVYYGQNTYTTLLNALQYLATDSFTEGEFTAHSLIFVGYLVLKGQTNNLTDTNNNRIINAGIFRNIAGGSSGGGAVAQTLNDLGDVTITTPTNGQALIYNSGTWENGTPSLATTASYVLNAVSASYAPDTTFPYTGSARITGSLGITGSFSVSTGSVTPLNTATYTLSDKSNIASVGWDNRNLSDSTAKVSVDWNSRTLHDSSGVGILSVDWRTRLLHGTNTSQSLDWNNRKLYDTSATPLLSLDWRSRDLTDTNESASLNWSSRTLSDSGAPGGSGIPVTSIDWENRQATDQFNVTSTDWSNRALYDGSGVTSTDWSNRYLYDGSGVTSTDWGNRALYDQTANAIIDYSGGSGYNISNYRPTVETLELTVQDEFTQTSVGFGISTNTAGNIIQVGPNVDLAVTASNPVFLDTDGIWKRLDQTTDTTTKLLGICVEPYNKGYILTEGIITVTTSSGYSDTTPFVSGSSFYGMPVYLTGSAAAFTTTKPTSGYVRVVGHMYYNSTANPDYWIMKFNPSNDWYEI